MTQTTGSSRTCINARASFLKSVIDFRPHVVTDLWNTALPEFRRVVLSRFRDKIFGDNEENYRGNEKALPESRPQVDYPVLILQQKLAPRPLATVTQVDPLREAFFSCHKASQLPENAQLLERIHEWSKRFNLDVDWCRDHALSVLRKWLYDGELRWVSAFPFLLLLIQSNGWRSAVNDLHEDADLSSILVDVDFHTKYGEPPPFEFHWWRSAINDLHEDADLSGIPVDVDFHTKHGEPQTEFHLSGLDFKDSWSLVTESESQFKRRVEVIFRLSLAEWEVGHLNRLVAKQAWHLDAITLESQLARSRGALQAFKLNLNEYVSEIKKWQSTIRSDLDLIQALAQPSEEQVKWLVFYQVPQDDFLCLPYSAIARSSSSTRDAVRKKVKNTADFIGLKLRDPSLNSGRPRLSRKRACL